MALKGLRLGDLISLQLLQEHIRALPVMSLPRIGD